MTTNMDRLVAVAWMEINIPIKGGIDWGTSRDHDIAMTTRQLQMVGLDAGEVQAETFYNHRFPSRAAKEEWLRKVEQEASEKIETALDEARQLCRDHQSYLVGLRQQYEARLKMFGAAPLSVTSADPNVVRLPRKLNSTAEAAEDIYLREIEIQEAGFPQQVFVIFGAIGISETTSRQLAQLIIDESA